MTDLQRLIFIPFISLLPCVVWLIYFYRHSRYKRPPLRLIALTFALGAFSTIPALFLNVIGRNLFYLFAGKTQITDILFFFCVVGPVEEGIKMLMVWIYAYRQPEFDEPLDGVIYSAAAALGFAAVENIFYISQNNPLFVLLRGPLSNPGHALFSAVWGLALCEAKTKPNLTSERAPIVIKGWLIAAMLHALFNTMLEGATKWHNGFFVVLIVAMVALFLWVRSRTRYHAETSPHREGTMLMPTRRYCQQCGAKGKAGMPCPRCGVIIPDPEELELCPVCTEPQRPSAKFCMRCGANIRLPAGENLDNRPHFVSITQDGDERIAFILNRDEIFVGRTLNNSFVIEHPSVSKRHARLIVEEDKYLLFDLDSSNGTFVNGKRIKEARLDDGCEVRFGRANFIYRSQRDGAEESFA
jgi:protease PrsW